ncbi:OmpH family outer membrane protein [Erythrobacter litoralis]|uniref:OmpH family outer membrane protein n=1 Tax=Erythrobacter litoralis TaxID=39960 RepID=UPI0024357A48|nr:OmpH family outer membrane protein [Erythrobacter litoralis]MDG6079968.1 OmpH family outer membrane protein [Erythrobacter litoralis]
MKFLTKALTAAALAGAATVSVSPAAAQVSGNIAVVDAPRVIASTAAFRSAYQQIGTTYQAQATQIQQKTQQRQTLLQQLDTNGDGQFDQTEQQAAQSAPQAAQIRQLETEIEQLGGQIEIARVYAIDQMLQQYPAVIQEVVQQNSIQILLSPDSVVFAPQAATINQKVVTAMDARVPSVQIAPPANYQPSRNAVAVYQEIQGLAAAAAQQQAVAAQQGQTQQPAAQPSGR